ncbi:MAG: hypothetical protein NVS9B14_08030 [Candidatus Acidiferrum sp.]
MAEHISRKELKQDKIRESFEHGAEAVYSHGRLTGILIALVLIGVVAYAGWKFYSDRQTVQASAAMDDAMKTYGARIGLPNPSDPADIAFSTEQAKAEAALRKFVAVADKYPHTNPGKLARYYQALQLEDLERHNQALEVLKPLSTGSDKELAAMAQYQMANVYARTGKTDDAVKTYRALAEQRSVFVPRPLVLIELADFLRQSNPKEAANLYQQIKKEFPDSSTVVERADRGLGMLAPKS